MECKELGLFKVNSNYLVKNFIYIIILIILNWLKKKNKFF